MPPALKMSVPAPPLVTSRRANAKKTRVADRRLRSRDQRSGVAELLTAVAAGLADDDPRRIRERLEQSLCRVIRLKAARLHVGQALSTGAAPAVRDRGGIDVPVPAGPAVLQAIPENPRRFDAWDLQVLQAAADLSGLVLELERAVAGARRGAARPWPPKGLVGSSAVMQALRERIARVARSSSTAPVLIEGESGVGKELVARQIHDLSRRARGPFIAVNCAALVESLLEAELFGIEDRTATGVRGRRGKFELADGGTLFLDEIGDLCPPAQAKLLRVMQEMTVDRVGGQAVHRVDVRVIAATNRSLAELVQTGRFRHDLFYRLNCVDVRVPPLRARRDDIPELVDLFLLRYADERSLTVAPEAIEALIEYDWPGNVRELERVIQRAATLAESHRITAEDLPMTLSSRYREIFQPALERNESLRAFAGRYVRLVLHRAGHNKREACRRLDISYHTLQAHLHHGSSDPDESEADERRAGALNATHHGRATRRRLDTRQSLELPERN